MITIRSSKAASQVALMCVEATLTTPRSVYSISSEGAMIDSKSFLDGNLFGRISWPVSRFRLADGLLLEQQMFLPHDGSAVALSWSLRGSGVLTMRLVVRPFFCGCGPRSYRDIGFHFNSEEDGSRLNWLPNVRGPRVFADTNGRYHDEPVRLRDSLCEEAAACSSTEHVISPGCFEFELSTRPAVLILSIDGPATAQHNQHIGVFLAGLMQENTPARADSSMSIAIETQQQALA